MDYMPLGTSEQEGQPADATGHSSDKCIIAALHAVDIGPLARMVIVTSEGLDAYAAKGVVDVIAEIGQRCCIHFLKSDNEPIFESFVEVVVAARTEDSAIEEIVQEFTGHWCS